MKIHGNKSGGLQNLTVMDSTEIQPLYRHEKKKKQSDTHHCNAQCVIKSGR